MTMPYYAPAEQIMRDRSEMARKGIARGRSVVALTYAGGVLLVAENHSKALHKVSELYDRLGFAAVGKYNEFENLRRAGIMHADMRGYSYDRRDVTGRSLANAYAQTLGTIFTEQPKPYEVEICVAEVAQPGSTAPAQLYRITYDGSIIDETTFVVMGGATESISGVLRETYQDSMSLADALSTAVHALENGTQDTTKPDTAKPEPRVLDVDMIEVAVLEYGRPRRAFRRISRTDLAALMPERPATTEAVETGTADETAVVDETAEADGAAGSTKE